MSLLLDQVDNLFHGVLPETVRVERNERIVLGLLQLLQATFGYLTRLSHVIKFIVTESDKLQDNRQGKRETIVIIFLIIVFIIKLLFFVCHSDPLQLVSLNKQLECLDDSFYVLWSLNIAVRVV